MMEFLFVFHVILSVVVHVAVAQEHYVAAGTTAAGIDPKEVSPEEKAKLLNHLQLANTRKWVLEKALSEDYDPKLAERTKRFAAMGSARLPPNYNEENANTRTEIGPKEVSPEEKAKLLNHLQLANTRKLVLEKALSEDYDPKLAERTKLFAAMGSARLPPNYNEENANTRTEIGPKEVSPEDKAKLLNHLQLANTRKWVLEKALSEDYDPKLAERTKLFAAMGSARLSPNYNVEDATTKKEKVNQIKTKIQEVSSEGKTKLSSLLKLANTRKLVLEGKLGVDEDPALLARTRQFQAHGLSSPHDEKKKQQQTQPKYDPYAKLARGK